MPGGSGAPAVERVRNGAPTVECVRNGTCTVERVGNGVLNVDRVRNVVVGRDGPHVFRDIDPGDPSNMPSLLAVE